MSYSIDIEVDEFYDSLSNYEKNELIDLLIEDDMISKNAKEINEVVEHLEIKSLQDREFAEAIDKLYRNRFLLSTEEEENIYNLAKRF